MTCQLFNSGLLTLSLGFLSRVITRLRSGCDRAAAFMSKSAGNAGEESRENASETAALYDSFSPE